MTVNDHVVRYQEHVSTKSYEELVAAFEEAVADAGPGEPTRTLETSAQDRGTITGEVLPSRAGLPRHEGTPHRRHARPRRTSVPGGSRPGPVVRGRHPGHPDPLRAQHR